MEKRIQAKYLHSDILENVYVGRTSDAGSSNHAGQMSDFNIWDYALTTDQMIQWTSCK